VDPASVISLISVAVVAIFTSITAPLILSHRTERMHRQDLLTEYKRQDEVAAAAKAAAAAMLAQQQLAAEAARLRDETSHALLSRIDVQAERIHTLVNSDMTAARQEELDQAEATIVVLERVIGVAEAKKIPPEPEDLAALAAAKTRRDKLEQILADRMHQLRQADADLRTTQAGRDLGADDARKRKNIAEAQENRDAGEDPG
jgi:hypothetical protein